MEQNLGILVLELCKLPKETEWVEFKHNNCDPNMIGEDISALANSATLCDKSHAYMIWGVDDSSHAIIGTTVNLSQQKKGNQEIENWLRLLLSSNADFSLHHFTIEGKEIDMIIISRAVQFPVSFQKTDYVRVGTYTKKLNEHKTIQSQLWGKLRDVKFEDVAAKTDLHINDILQLLNINLYFDLLKIPQPTDINQALHYLSEDELIVRQDNGLYTITNLGAILFAKKLSAFERLGRKALRIVQYEGLNKYQILKEKTADEGYALCFENMIEFLNALLPSKENVNVALRTIESDFPLSAIREAIANALIHQDFFVTGAGPVVEVFSNRVEITNPGIPLVDIYRIIDNPPKSRNEKLASLMRRLDMCEELGRGWDRMVLACELQQISAPRIIVYEDATKVSMFSKLEYANIPMEDRLWSLYLHACLLFVQGEAMSNSTVRKRFGLKESSAAVASRLIRQGLKCNIIKAVDTETAQRYLKYIPVWS